MSAGPPRTPFGHRATVLIALVTAIGAYAGAASDQTQGRPFQLSTDAVLVDVGVMKDGKPVSGLTAADFELSDNGTRQKIDMVGQEMMPLDVSLLVDTSGSVAAEQELFRADVGRIASRLRDVDALRVVTFGRAIALSMPLQPARQPVALAPGAGRNATVLNDALLYAFLQPTERGRRHAILVLTDAVDTRSWLDAPRVADIARHSDALMSVIVSGRPPFLDEFARFMRSQTEQEDPFWRELARNGLPILGMDPYVAAARATGGDVYDRPAQADAVAAFSAVLDSIRLRYVLGYVPEGVRRDGWHKLSVKLPKFKNYDVRAREGYGVAR